MNHFITCARLTGVYSDYISADKVLCHTVTDNQVISPTRKDDEPPNNLCTPHWFIVPVVFCKVASHPSVDKVLCCTVTDNLFMSSSHCVKLPRSSYTGCKVILVILHGVTFP